VVLEGLCFGQEGDGLGDLWIPLGADLEAFELTELRDEEFALDAFFHPVVDASDVAAMEILADQISAALEKSRALAAEQKRAAHLALVSDIAARATSTSEPDEILQTMVELVAARCRAVVRIPWDAHLEAGAESSLERLRPAARNAYLQLAAAVADGFTDGGQPDRRTT